MEAAKTIIKRQLDMLISEILKAEQEINARTRNIEVWRLEAQQLEKALKKLK